ncbi:alpha-tocopherol transfer protein-like [Cimex lectularius]|uniref:CRAL-TRIO domain-containing protein n=1 Tax=Cimex lectularius TaxID=79782 RepID=A0A8I6R955_CIMLE|nr:alpha-tocopherol transfer protein-like [Cimex lectularius]
MALIPLTKEQEEAILHKAGYTATKLAEDVAVIREWLDQQEHLPPSRKNENDAFITNFLLGCKGKLSSCKKKLDAYYSLRSHYGQLFSDRNPEDLEPSLQYLEAMTIPKPTEDGCRINVAVLTDQEFNFEACLKRILLVLEIRLRSEAIYAGDYIISDVGMFLPKHIFKVSIPLLHQFLQFALKAIPYRLKGLIFFNTSYLFEVGINRFLKPFLKAQIAKRVYMYSEGKEILRKHFDVSFLPKEFGGATYEIKPLSEYWLEEGKAWKEWFLTDGSELTDESKRPQNQSYFRSFWTPHAKQTTAT